MKATFALVPALLLALSISAFSQNIESITTPLTTPSGEQTSIAQIGKGKPTVVSFWATWCKPCKEEMKAMGPIYERLKGKIAYVAVSIDNTKTMAKVGPFIESKGYTFPVLLDPNSEVFLMLNGTNVPYTVIFNADGTLHSKHDGYLEGDEVKLEEELVGMIPTNTPAGQ